MREHLTGQFTPGTSILHLLDARAKFFGFLILIAATVCTDAWPGYALLLAVTAAVVAICGLPLRTALASVARMGWFFLLIFAMNALFSCAGSCAAGSSACCAVWPAPRSRAHCAACLR